MRIPVLPRELAGRIITSSVSRMGWAVALATIAVTVPVLIETLAQRGRIDELPVPLAALGAMAVVLVALGWRGSRWSTLTVLAVVAVAGIVYELALVATDPSFLTEYVYLVNRPAYIVVLVGAAATTPAAGVAWACIAYLTSWVVTFAASLIGSVPVHAGFGPTLVFAIIVIGYLMLAGIQLARQRALPDFDELEAETQRLAMGEDLARKTTAVVHDTVLNDLALVMNAPEQLSPPARERLREDIATLRGAEWLQATTRIPTGNDDDATFRNDVMKLLNDFQWQGLSVHVTGVGAPLRRIEPEVAAAVLGALRACLENVVKHSGAGIAELEIVYGDDAMTVMVTDQGSGFDLTEVPSDRLGLRASVVERLAAVGGRAEIWTAPGEGTSIIMSIPARQIAPDSEELTRREAERGE